MKDQRSRTSIFFSALSENLPAAALYVASTGSLMVGLCAQFVGFIVLARYLGAAQFGHLMAITAATSIALSISGLGTEEVLLRRCVREPTLYPELLGHSLILILISGSVLSIIAVLGLNVLVRLDAGPLRNVETLSIFVASNIILARGIVLTEFILIAQKKTMHANIVVAGFALARALAAIVGCVLFGVNRLETWALWHGGVHVVGTLACIAAIGGYGAPRWCILGEEIWRGIHGSTMQLVSNLSQNIDRLVLTTVVSPMTVGAYSVASNIVRSSLVTLLSFSRLVYSNLAIAGVNGAPATLKLAVKYLPIITGLGAANTIGLFVIAPFLPSLFGSEYGESVHYLILFCWLPILVAIQNIAYDALGAAEKHGVRALFYNITGIVGAGLIAGLTYFYGVNGAVVGIYLSLVVISVGLWLILIVLGQRDKKKHHHGL